MCAWSCSIRFTALEEWSRAVNRVVHSTHASTVTSCALIRTLKIHVSGLYYGIIYYASWLATSDMYDRITVFLYMSSSNLVCAVSDTCITSDRMLWFILIIEYYRLITTLILYTCMHSLVCQPLLHR